MSFSFITTNAALLLHQKLKINIQLKDQIQFTKKTKVKLSIQLSRKIQTPLNKKFLQSPEISGFCFCRNMPVGVFLHFPVQLPKKPFQRL